MSAFLIAYCLLLLLVGVWASRTVRRPEDFFVAGRNLPAGLLFATFFAANVGAGSTVGAAEFGYTSGLPAWWWVGSAGLGSLFLAFAAGPRLHRTAKARDLYTLGDYLEFRYGHQTRLAAAAVLLCGAPAILAGQILALGFVLHVAVGLPEWLGTALGGAVATAYFAMGGLRTAAWVNLVQVVVKVAGFGLSTPWLIRSSGGWDALAAAAPGRRALSLTGAGPARTAQLVLTLAPAFVVSPGLVQKLYGAHDEAAVRRGVGLQGAALLGYAFVPVLLGMAARVHFPELDNPGPALIRLFGEVAPPWLGALVLAAIVSAELSSADAVLFMISTSLVRDFLEPRAGRPRSDVSLLRLARRAALAAGAAGTLLALALKSVLAALTFFYSLLTISLCVPVLAGLAGPNGSERTALTSIGCSLAAAGLAQAAGGRAGEGWLHPVPVGIAAGAAVFGAAAARGWRRRSV